MLLEDLLGFGDELLVGLVVAPLRTRACASSPRVAYSDRRCERVSRLAHDDS